jgi:hypothetical protein
LPLRSFIGEVAALRASIRAVGAGQLNSVPLRRDVRTLVDKFFTAMRTAISRAQDQDEGLRALDAIFQELLILSHRRGRVARYVSLLANAKEQLVAIDARTATLANVDTPQTLAKVDSDIVSTLGALVPAAALSYQQAALDLQNDFRHSWRGPACDLREALRETLDYLAPDSEVMSQSGFKLEPTTKGPTMKQKVRFILRKRRVSSAQADAPETAVEAVDDLVGGFIRSVYTGSSGATHTPASRDDVLRIRDWVRVALCQLLEIRA